MNGDDEPTDSLRQFVEQSKTEEIEKQFDDLEEQIGEVADDGKITLEKGNFEELVILMIQDLKLDLLEIKEFLAEVHDVDIETEE